ncbi:MAG: DUF4406 domain-containing protein [Agathobacter sp.]
MKIYIIHCPKYAENYFEKIRETEKRLIEYGHSILNPLPEGVEEKQPEWDNINFFRTYANRINYCDMVYAMIGWEATNLSEHEMKEAMNLKKHIVFEQLPKFT